MFSDKYKKYNDKITLPKELRAYIDKRLENAENEQTSEGKKDYFKTTFWRASAAALSFVVLVATTYVGMNNFRSNIPVGGTVSAISSTSSNTSSEVVSKTSSATSSKPAPKAIQKQSLVGVKYSEIYESFKKIDQQKKKASSTTGSYKAQGTFVAEPYSAMYAVPSSSAVVKDYSQTNTQVEGVDEADIVKTDGSYIYTLNDGKVVITSATQGNLNKVSEIQTENKGSGLGSNLACTDMVLDHYSYTKDMYVSGNRLALIKIESYFSNSSKASEQVTILYLYDITNQKTPKLLKKVGQSGNYISSRLTGGVLYLFSNQYFYNEAVKEKTQTYIPATYSNNKMKVMPEKDICVFGGAIDKKYLIAGSYQLATGNQISAKSVLGGGTTIYANTENVLVAAASYGSYYYMVGNAESTESSSSKTRLIRLSVKNGIIGGEAIGSVPGTLLNQFSMDEYNGYFRLVTTIYNQGSATNNALYVLDGQLKTTGRIGNIAKGERVYSVRFTGKTGYFVTFRKTDPLFSVDLSNPKKPKILGALKIPGFSNYLHPYSEGLLFGLGKNANAETGRTGLMKLSMFDISNPEHVTEKNKISVNSYYSAASYNHKAILINQQKDIIGFPGSSAYFIYGYSKDEGFYKRAELPFHAGEYSYNTRGLFIGNYFYVCQTKNITSYSINDWKAADSQVIS